MWDKAIDQKNLDRIDQLLSSKVVLHADKVWLHCWQAKL